MSSLTDPSLEALWKRVTDDWENDAAHGAFLEHCQQTGQLVEAAVRYRGMTGDRDKGPTAEKRLKGVAVLAMASLETSRRPTKQTASRLGSLLMIAFFLTATAVLLYWVNR